MKMKIDDFKRDVYFDILKNRNKNVTFLLGPRKCGKTYALMQLERDYPEKFIYIDIKSLTDDKKYDVIDEIIADIHNGRDITYLIDETTYLNHPEAEISRIACEYKKAQVKQTDIKTKIVFSGSQSVALKSWGKSAFCNEAEFINISFLTYKEWLNYAKIPEISEQSYAKYVNETFNFYKDFTSLREYLEGCLEETIKSNANARNYIYGNDCDLVSVDNLIDISYLILFQLHDNPSATNFFKNNSLTDSLSYLYRTSFKNSNLTIEDFNKKIEDTFLARYNNVTSLDIDTLRQCFSFLIRCDLITPTPVFQDFESNVDVLLQLEREDGQYQKKSNLLGKVNFTINYPMFYVEIVKEVFNIPDIAEINRTLLGNIIECQIRGLLPYKQCYEYRNEEYEEIDYINPTNNIGIEFTIRDNKKNKEVHLDLLPDNYLKVLLTKNDGELKNGYIHIPYYEFIYNMSNENSEHLLEYISELKKEYENNINLD